MTTIRVNDIRATQVRRTSDVQRDAVFGVRAQRRTRRQQGQNSFVRSVRTRTADPLRATMWTEPKADGSPQYAYTFPFTPQQIDYTNLGPELSEVLRPGRKPIVAFTRFKARQIALRFLIAVPQDGLFASVDDSVQELQRMVNTASRVYFTNMDKQITNSLTTESSQVFWSIIDFTLSSVRRNADNKITSAEATLTLVENTNPIISAVELPKITYSSNAPANSTKSSNKSRSGDFLAPSWTDTLNDLTGGQSLPTLGI